MKIVKSKNGKSKMTISKKEWENIGEQRGWIEAQVQNTPLQPRRLIAAEELTKEAKWGKDVDVEQPGKWTNYSKAELIKKRDAAKKRQEGRDKADPKDTELLRELNFAIRAKGDWGKAD